MYRLIMWKANVTWILYFETRDHAKEHATWFKPDHFRVDVRSVLEQRWSIS